MDIQVVSTMILDTPPVLPQIILINLLLHIDFIPTNNLSNSLVKILESITYNDIIKEINNNKNNNNNNNIKTNNKKRLD
jgi:hypothetical protein